MKKPVANLLLFIFSFSSLISAQAQTDKNASHLFEMQQYNKAKAVYQKNLRTISSADSWYYLGKIYLIQNNTDSARICFSAIGLADPKSNLLQVVQAMNEFRSGNKTVALQNLDKAQKSATSSKDIISLLEIAETRIAFGDTAKWLEPLTTASGFDRKNPAPYIVAGKLYSKLGEGTYEGSYTGLASGRYEQALYYDPQNSEAQTKLAEINILARNYQDAETMLDKVLARDSSYIPALKALGELSYSLGKYEKASRIYGSYINIAEYSDKELARYITILYFNKEYAKAKEMISKILIKDPNNPVMLRLKGYTSYELNNNPDGLESMNRFFSVRSAADTNKIIATDYEYYGKLLARTGSDSLAVYNLNKAFEMDTSNPSLLEDIAKSLEKQKKYLQAVKYYEQYIGARHGAVPATTHFNIGKDMLVLANEVVSTADSLERPKHLARADSAFSKVIELSPSSYLGYLWRARAEAGLDPETLDGLAKPDYEKAISILEAKNDSLKYGKDLIEAYRYLGYYYYLKYDAAKSAKDEVAREQAKTDSISFWQKVLGLDPANEIAKQAIAALKK